MTKKIIVTKDKEGEIMEFSEACSEIDYILENLNPEDKKKLPKILFEIFKENKAIFYKVNLDTNKPLAEQKLKDETKAFLQIIGYKYFSNAKEKEEFKEFLENTQEIEEQEFKKEELQQTEMIVYQENKILSWFKKIFRIFKKL